MLDGLINNFRYKLFRSGFVDNYRFRENVWLRVISTTKNTNREFDNSQIHGFFIFSGVIVFYDYLPNSRFIIFL